MQDNAEQDVLAPTLAENFGILDADEELNEDAKLQELLGQNGQKFETPEKQKLLGGDQQEEKQTKQRKLPFHPKVTENELNNPEIGLYKLAQKMKRIDRAPLRDDSRILEDICKAYEEWQISFCPRFQQYWFLQKVCDLGKKQSVQLHMEEIRRDHKGATPLNQIIETETFANYKFGKLQQPTEKKERGGQEGHLQTPLRPAVEQFKEKQKQEPGVKIKSSWSKGLTVNPQDIKGNFASLYRDLPSYAEKKKKEPEELEKLDEEDIPDGLFDD